MDALLSASKLPACCAPMVSSLYHALLAFGLLLFWSDIICLFRAGYSIRLLFTGCSERVYFLSEYILHVLPLPHFVFFFPAFSCTCNTGYPSLVYSPSIAPVTPFYFRFSSCSISCLFSSPFQCTVSIALTSRAS